MKAEDKRISVLSGTEDVVGEIMGWKIIFFDGCWKRQWRTCG
jgi:hypothetical protein